MDVLQIVCRKAAASSARPSLLALSSLRTAPTTSRSPFSTTRLFLADEPPRPPPATAQTEGIMRLRNSLKKTIEERNRGGDSLFGGRRLGPSSSLRTGASLDHFSELIKQDANQSLMPFEEEDFFKAHMNRTDLEANLRLRPVTGRTVNVRNGDVMHALKTLNRSVMQNNVRRDEMGQRFHERPALKRKRKLRERWRARFKEGVSAAISRTLVLRSQGW